MHEWILLPLNCFFNCLVKFEVRLPAETIYFVVSQRIAAIMAGSILDESNQVPVHARFRAANRTVQDAICLMNAHRIGALVVTDQESGGEAGEGTPGYSHQRYSWGGTTRSIVESSDICGVITERDVMRTCGAR